MDPTPSLTLWKFYFSGYITLKLSLPHHHHKSSTLPEFIQAAHLVSVASLPESELRH
jgi:hypothetical protein